MGAPQIPKYLPIIRAREVICCSPPTSRRRTYRSLHSTMAFAVSVALPARLQAQRGVSARPARRVRVARRVRMTTATPAPETERRPGSHKGFVEEMRFVAMKLHTKDQAPREGEVEESALPIDAWYPTRADFMQFLIDSRHVYEYFENDLVHKYPMFTRFRDTGLERVEALNADIGYLRDELGVEESHPSPAATGYVAYLQRLVEDKPESTLCHWYNYYFAHSAGGRMIGRLMQQRLFDGRSFRFYEWESDVKQLLTPVRATIDEVAAEWSREVKDICLKETGLAFGYSGTVLQNLAKDGGKKQ